MKKVLIRLCVVLFVVGMIFMNEFGIVRAKLGDGFNDGLVTPHHESEIEPKIEEYAVAIARIIRILAVAALAIVGMKYMFADSHGKSKIKDNLIWVLGGVLLVTSASVIIQIVANAGKEALK